MSKIKLKDIKSMYFIVNEDDETLGFGPDEKELNNNITSIAMRETLAKFNIKPEVWNTTIDKIKGGLKIKKVDCVMASHDDDKKQ